MMYPKGRRGGQFLAQSYAHIRQSAPMDITHFASGFYSTPGLVFYVFPEINFSENSHFLVSPSVCFSEVTHAYI